MGSEIVFHRDERWVEKDQMMAFTAEIGGRRIPCFIAEEVLKTHFSSGRFGRFQAFRENRQQIEEVAGRKIRPEMTELQLGAADFTEASDFIPWER